MVTCRVSVVKGSARHLSPLPEEPFFGLFDAIHVLKLEDLDNGYDGYLGIMNTVVGADLVDGGFDARNDGLWRLSGRNILAAPRDFEVVAAQQ